MSASNTAGVAGIDANTETVHNGGLGCTGKGSRGTAPFASVVGYVSANEPTPEIGYLAYGGRSKAGTSALATTPVGTQYTRLERQVAFGEAAAVSGMMRVDLEVTNTLATGLNPGKLQFELVNNATGQVSILMPAFTGWYVGGKTDAIPANGVRKFRFHTNAFYGDSLGGAFTVRVTNVGGAVAFTSSLTSYSQ